MKRQNCSCIVGFRCLRMSETAKSNGRRECCYIPINIIPIPISQFSLDTIEIVDIPYEIVYSTRSTHSMSTFNISH